MDFDLHSPVKDESFTDFSKSMLLFALGLAGMFVFPVVFAVLLVAFFPTSDPELLNYIAYFLGYGSYIICLGFFLKKDKVNSIIKGVNMNNVKVALIFTVILYLSSILISTILTIIFGDNLGNENQGTLEKSVLNYPLIIFIFTVIFAPMVEEFVFRFSIFRPLAQKNKIVGYVVTVLFFAGIHFISSFGALSTNIEQFGEDKAYTMLLNDLKTLPIYIVGAFVLTLSYDMNRNISTNILIHMLYNGIQFALMLVNKEQLIEKYQSSSMLSFFDFIEFKNIFILLGI